MRIIRSIYRRFIKNLGTRTIYTRGGMKLLLNPENHVDFRLAARLPVEEHQIAKAINIVNKEKLTVVLDIGANIGLYTVALGQLQAVKRIHAFEPVRANYNQLCANVYLNNLNMKVDAHRAALGDKADHASIYIEPKSTGRSRLNPDYSGDRQAFTEHETVKIFRLDDYLPLAGERVFVKLDVEGHALEVLQGMTQFMQKNHVYIQAELLEYDREKIVRFLEGQKYELYCEIDVDGYFRPLVGT